MRLALASGLAAFCLASSAFAADFSYNPPGTLVSGSGTGRVDSKVYAPGMRFPIEKAPAYANSQVWGHGGSSGPGGGQCDVENFSYPWWDNYCETRSWSMPLCPAGKGHQGQDIRAATCTKNVHATVATTDGKITSIGTYSVYLTGNDGTVYRYLHMGSLAVSTGQTVKKGDPLGKVSNEFGGTPTTVHLHFDLEQNVSGIGKVFVPPYTSLVESYQALVGPVLPKLDAKFVAQGSDAEADPEGKAYYRVCAGEPVHFWFELENTGALSWTDAGSGDGQAIRLGVPGDGTDPFTGTSRISLNENANASVSPTGGDCNDQAGCRRTVFQKTPGISGVAPSVPGVYESRWRLLDELKAWFGPEMFLTFNVVDCAGDGAAGSSGSAGSAGSAGAGGSGQKTRVLKDDAGDCSCRAPGGGAARSGALFLLLAAALSALRRRSR
ncbi:MAG: peptidoglycan DD-metalloendopeptidase family protein [Myxococcales bacterium]|nr:peptidoglycan DD-metalloendopeptidase family protein [Myxococcales bacterium]